MKLYCCAIIVEVLWRCCYMFVAKIKIIPHFVYCRLWRYPDAQTVHQLCPVAHCKFPYPANGSSFVCVNPYHYDMKQNSLLPMYIIKEENDMNVLPASVSSEKVNSFDENILNELSLDWFNNNFDISQICKSEDILYPDLTTANTSLFQDTVKPTEFWCSIKYHEFNQAVGDTFQVRNPSVTVDGYTDTTGNNFSLGLLANVNRTECVEHCRKHIGRGVKLTNSSDGTIFLECLGDYPVFVQSPNANQDNNWPLATVCRLSSKNCQFKIFDSAKFASTLSQCFNEGYEAVYSLMKLCTIRLSFVKGWGVNYRRQSISATPCWLEIRVNGPCQLLDRVLRQMTPQSGIDSKT